MHTSFENLDSIKILKSRNSIRLVTLKGKMTQQKSFNVFGSSKRPLEQFCPFGIFSADAYAYKPRVKNAKMCF